MYLIHSLVPTSKASIQNALDADSKKISGFEMGTWTFPDYVEIISKALNGNEWFGEEIRKEEYGKFSYSIRKTFSKKEMDKIRKWLVGNSQTVVVKGTKYVEIMSKAITNDQNILMQPKWFDRFLELFSNESDTVSWLSA